LELGTTGIDAVDAPWTLAATRFGTYGGTAGCATLLGVVGRAGCAGSGKAATLFCFLPLALAIFGGGDAFFAAAGTTGT
jgi:hypothetical protein